MSRILWLRTAQGAGGAALTNLIHVGGVTDSAANFRSRLDGEAGLSFEYGTASDLTGSATTTPVAVDSTSDYTGGGTASGLSANTVYYWCPLVDGARALSAPFPQFQTSPTIGTDAAFAFVAGSCQLDPDDTIFGVVASESPRFMVHTGDIVYIDSTVLDDHRTAYKAMYAGDFEDEILRKMWVAWTWSDHDFCTNNSLGTVANKADFLQVAKEYHTFHALESPTNGLWHSFEYANALFVMTDGRYQREGSRPEYPDYPNHAVLESGSTGNTFVLPAAATPSVTTKWYAEILTDADVFVGVYRVTGYTSGTKTGTLNGSPPGLAPGYKIALKRSSMLDMDALGASSQTEWLISTINASARRWVFFVSAEMWNRTFTGDSQSIDSWGGYDFRQLERKYILQRITHPGVIVLSGDRHYSAIDDGTNSDYPEVMASPFNNTNITPGGGATWSEGTYSAGKAYALIEVLANNDVRITVKTAAGADAIGPFTVAA